MKYLLSIDPGKSSGCALFEYSDESPAELLKAWQFRGGLGGFLDWRRNHIDIEYGEEMGWIFYDAEIYGTVSFYGSITTVAEKFTPLQNSGFGLTLDSVEPLRIEGAMVALGLVPDYEAASSSWQRPNEMYWVPGKNAAEKRKNQVAWVKERFPELHLTGKMVGAPDADDARSALWHGMVWLRKHHKPSARHWFGGE